ncbi:MAG: SET domain-containing protein-lysine N-methyltransferase [Sphingobacteriaceae bacterium]
MENLYTSASPIAGTGLFTKKEIREKEIILSFRGDHIFHDYTPDFALQGANWIGVGDMEWVVPQPGSPVLYLNHSCSPNVFITEKQELISACFIPADSELFLDYSSTELDPYWSMKCNCQSGECRQVIKSFPYLPPTKQLQYRSFISRIFWDESQRLSMNGKRRLYG